MLGGLGGLLGLNGGFNGTGAAGPSGADLTNPVTPGQVGTAYGGVQNSLLSQQQLLQALQQQNALQNQSQVYGQLQNVAAGQGPNPAQAMLNQATGQNVANQAALMAGQRGAGANVGLMARQAAQQGAALQQQAVGQGATMQAQQSLNAIGAAGNMANTQAGQLTGQTNANVQGQLGEQQNLLNAQNAYNNAQVGMQGNINSVNGGLAQSTQGLMGSALGGAAQGAGAAGMKSIIGAAQGGVVPPPKSAFLQYLTGAPAMAKGGEVPVMLSPGETYIGPEKVLKALESKKPLKEGKKVPGQPKFQGNDYRNDVVPAKAESGGIVIPNEIMQSENPEQEAHKFISAILAKKGVR